jgi:hypothetical protein
MKSILTLIFASILALATYAQDVIEVTFDGFAGEPVFVEGWDTWTINLKNEAYRFSFDIISTADSYAGIFSMNDGTLDGSFSFGIELEQNTRFYFNTCDLTITESHPSVTTTRYTLVANIVSEDNIHYSVTATHDVLTITETVEAEILDALITPTDYGFVLTAQKAELDLDICISITRNYDIEGYFRNYHVDSLNTAITHKGKTFIPSELVMDVEFVSALSSGKPGYSIPALQFLSPDAVAYILNVEAPIVATDIIDITCTNLTHETLKTDISNSVILTGSNATYAISITLFADALTKGTYEGEDATVEITNLATQENISSLISKVTVAGNKLKGYTVEVEVIGTDNKFYTIHLDASNPTTDINNIGVTNLTKKTIINGSLVIIKNGVKYNALGQIID